MRKVIGICRGCEGRKPVLKSGVVGRHRNRNQKEQCPGSYQFPYKIVARYNIYTGGGPMRDDHSSIRRRTPKIVDTEGEIPAPKISRNYFQGLIVVVLPIVAAVLVLVT